MPKFKVYIEVLGKHNLVIEAESEDELTKLYIENFIPLTADDTEMDIYSIEEIIEEGESDD